MVEEPRGFVVVSQCIFIRYYFVILPVSYQNLDVISILYRTIVTRYPVPYRYLVAYGLDP